MAALSGGRVRFGRWVPQMSKECRQPQGGATTSPPLIEALPANAPAMIRAYNATLDKEAEEAAQHRSHTISYRKATQHCTRIAQPAFPTLTQSPPSLLSHSVNTRHRRWRCDDADLGASGVRLLVGVHTSPTNRARRDAIRASWATYPTNATLVCFVVGLRSLSEAARGSLATEAAEHGDLARLGSIDDDGCHMSIAKAHGWWDWASAHRVAHVARVDDDTYLSIPNLERALEPLRCHARLVYGVLAHVGYNPETFSKCGYSWSGPGAWRKYQCARGGSHQPMPFPSGMLQVLSAPLVAALVNSPTIRDFASRATRLIRLRDWDRTEDVALGFWLSQLLVDGSLRDISFVRATSTQAHNLGCQKNNALYHYPGQESVAIHYVKRPSGMSYLHQVVRGEAPHVPRACTRAAGVG
jgi:hypothetical protein